MGLTRRTFLKVAGTSVAVTYLPLPGCSASAPVPPVSDVPEAPSPSQPAPSPQPANAAPVAADPFDEHAWSAGPGRARYRIDGYHKVTGRKVFARDMYPRDMDGWPTHEHRALLIRATYADRPYLGIDLGRLPPEAQPERTLTARDLKEDHMDVQSLAASHDVLVEQMAQTEIKALERTMRGRPRALRQSLISARGIDYDLLAEVGKPPSYLGQPVAMLLYSNRQAYRLARPRVRFDRALARYGEPTEPAESKAYHPLTNYVRVAGQGAAGQGAAGQGAAGDVFSFAQFGWNDDYRTNADQHRSAIAAEIASKQASGEWLVYDDVYTTQALDPMFMEPESGLAWYDDDSETLHLVLGTQSPESDVYGVLNLFASRECPIKIREVKLTCCYPGGGFGGRDKSDLPLHLAVAAALADGPVRLAYDRFEQFQAGLKRQACTIVQRLAVDRSGILQAVLTEMTFDGGGRKNLNPYVANYAAICAGGSYALSRAAVKSTAFSSVSIPAGSQRGFGGPQAFFAVESTLDQMARDQGWDPIELREKNLLRQGDRTVIGGPIDEDLRLGEICATLREHPLWRDRARTRTARQKDGVLYGVGLALSNQAYGTSGDGMVAQVMLDASGALTVVTNAVDMGNGSATTLALATAQQLGANARTAVMGSAETFSILALKSGGRSGDWSDPRWTRKTANSTSACLTAYHQVHAVEQASAVLYHAGIVPTALSLWGASDVPSAMAWEQGALTAPGLRPLTLPEIAAELHRLGGIHGATVHAYFQASWVSADYVIDGKTHRFAIDALAVHRAGAGASLQLIDRQNGSYPPEEAGRYSRTRFAPSGNLIAVEVERASGRVQVTDAVTVLSAGPLLVPDIVDGQCQGGLAMAIGATLLEDLPAGMAGPAAGDWNLHRYHVPLASDLPLTRQTLITLPPRANETRAKGIAEAVMCGVSAAIANAIFDATGVRFRELPITPEKVRKALP